MTFMNEAEWDRTARVLIGIALLAAGTVFMAGTTRIFVSAIGALAFITGLGGWCPAYALGGFTTKRHHNHA
jgi:hypothetical protein